ncbi:MAG: hypothetical protein HFI10_09425 [Lachnospiraceae bacterium]|jgi:hypothetical protein|nr:hypothetical protein [Lachnospiraceae bacterium]
MKKKLLKILGIAAIAFIMACLVLVLFLYLLDKDSKEYVKQLEESSNTIENHYFVDGKELTEDEYKEYLEEMEKQEEELTEDKKAAIYTIQQLRDSLKNPHSMKIYSIFYKYNTTNNWYLFKIEYSAENQIGGTVEDTLYYQFDTDIYSDDSEKALSARMFGCKEIDWNSYGKDYNGDETEIEVDIILNNIDTDILEEKQ